MDGHRPSNVARKRLLQTRQNRQFCAARRSELGICSQRLLGARRIPEVKGLASVVTLRNTICIRCWLGLASAAPLGGMHVVAHPAQTVPACQDGRRSAVAVQVHAEPVNNLADVPEDHRQCSLVSEQPQLSAWNGVCQPACVR
jgi:hypothetical protein